MLKRFATVEVSIKIPFAFMKFYLHKRIKINWLIGSSRMLQSKLNF